MRALCSLPNSHSRPPRHLVSLVEKSQSQKSPWIGYFAWVCAQHETNLREASRLLAIAERRTSFGGVRRAAAMFRAARGMSDDSFERRLADMVNDPRNQGLRRALAHLSKRGET